VQRLLYEFDIATLLFPSFANILRATKTIIKIKTRTQQ